MDFNHQATTVFASEIGQQLRVLAGKAIANAEGEVNRAINSAETDEQRIEHLLDHLLNFCYDEAVLHLFKQLCRYYYTFNPEATTRYVHYYREMWDAPEAPDEQE